MASALWAVFGAALLLALSPGPDLLFTMSHAATAGSRSGLLFVAGLCTGLIGHTTLIALGVGTVIAHTPWALLGLKVVGAAYLLSVAWAMWRAGTALAELPTHGPLQGLNIYRRGVLMNLSNPKVLLFFLALLPQFLVPNAWPFAWQLAAFGGLFLLASAIVFAGAAALAARAHGWFSRHPRAVLLINRAAALVMVGVATQLAL